MPSDYNVFAKWLSIYFRVIRGEIKSSRKNSILNSFKITGQTPPSLYPKGKFLMLTAAYNIKHNNVYECRYRQEAFSMWLTIHIRFLRGQVTSYEHCLLHYEVVHIHTSLATQDLNATKIPQTLPLYTYTESVVLVPMNQFDPKKVHRVFRSLYNCKSISINIITTVLEWAGNLFYHFWIYFLRVGFSELN